MGALQNLLSSSFQFSQSSLQDYADCPRRFQLRHILNQPWPAVESEPLLEREHWAEMGRRFHLMAFRHALGLPVESIAASATGEPDLLRWWQSYLECQPAGLPQAVRRAEVMLVAPLGAFTLAAKCDLLAIDPGRRGVIVDWKTGRRRPNRHQLASRMQTRVYRYVMVEAGAAFSGGQPLLPEQVTMIYWFAEFPDQPEILGYDQAQYQQDAAYLRRLAGEIASCRDPEFPMTSRPDRCHFCTYRSLCDRGVEAGVTDAAEAELDLEIDLDEIQEIAY